MCQFFCGKNSGLITYLHYNYMWMRGYNKYKKSDT